MKETNLTIVRPHNSSLKIGVLDIFDQVYLIKSVVNFFSFVV